MSNNKLLFKNNLKNILKNKIQFIGLVFLVFLTSLIFTITDITKTRIQSVYDDFISEKMSNQHDFIIDYEETTYNSRKFKDMEEDPFFKKLSNLEQRQEFMLNYLKDLVKAHDKNLDFDFNRVETRTFALNNKKTLKAVSLNQKQTIDKFIVQSGMPLEFWSSYHGALNDYSKRWVYVSPGFAKANNIAVNDIIRLESDSFGNSIKVGNDIDLSIYENKDINDWIENSKYANENWFRVVGMGSSADFVTPIIDQTKPIPNSNDEGLVYVNPELFGNHQEEVTVKISDELEKTYFINHQNQEQPLQPKSSRDIETYYVGKFKNSSEADKKSAILNSFINTEAGAKEIGLYGFNERTGNTSSKLLTYKFDADYKYSMRTTFLDTTLEAFNLVSLILMIVILLISFFVLITIIKKQIENTTRQNGILRALGCRRHSIVTSYLAYPLMIALAGGILGFIIGMSFQEITVSLFRVYFNIPYQNFIITLTSLFTCVFLIFILLTLVTLITCTIMMNRTPLEMIYSDGKSSTNKFKLAMKKTFTFRKNFNSRFRGALLSNSIDKMVGVAATMFVSTAVIGIATITPLILKDNIKYTYYNTSYNTEVEYYQPVYNIPTSFYKTYDPTVKAWDATSESNYFTNLKEGGTNMTDDIDVLINQYLTGKINPETYSPTFNPRDLTNLLYKNTSKEFLKSNKISLAAGDNVLAKIIIDSTWSDYSKYSLSEIKDKNTILKMTESYQAAKENVESLEKLRKFYLKYRDTVGLDVKRPDFFDEKGQFNFENNDLISKEQFGEIGRFAPKLNSKGQLSDEYGYDIPFSEQLETSALLSRVQFLSYSIWNWTKSYFIDNINQAFIQGIYSKSPYEVRKNIKASFENSNKDYNILFGVVPYTPETDDIGTYFKAMSSDVAFNVFGIKEDSKNQKLIDRSSNKNLISELYKTEKGIVLNATLAKQLNIRVGQKINLRQLESALYKGEEKLKTDTWDSSAIDAKIPGTENYTNSKYLYSGSGNDSENLIKWKNSEISDNYILNSTVNLAPSPGTAPINPSGMNKAIVKGDIALKSEYQNLDDFVVTGITNQYGDAKAWIKESEAKQISRYDESEAQLFQLFIKEWINPYVKKDVIVKNSDLLDELKNLGKYETKSGESAQIKFEEFKNSDNKYKTEILKMFANEYPLFNYKLSASKNIDDIDSGLTQTQTFGDYSVPAMQGGTFGSDFYPSFGREAAANLLPKEQVVATLESILGLANSVLIFIAIISIILSFIIIMLTSNVIISENMRIIATMKVLGYSNRSITNLVLSMYIPIVIVTSILGFFTSIGILQIGVGILAVNGTIVPLMMQWYWPLFVVSIVFALYTISYLMSWYSMNRVNPLHAIQID
ncbi:ABC transporter permease [Spiroplasma alleghenense]|uniref:ABC transporter permease n=1 Tax=Spiroplasma alleghenense TaxID=216931 RepID=A0A345Z3F3_9MOLU|nr:ABC transporter permease [Spiroplasma alleghenense]AXK51132.1 ABC transporter permease [Spiroplasma alleghenense]